MTTVIFLYDVRNTHYSQQKHVGISLIFSDLAEVLLRKSLYRKAVRVKPHSKQLPIRDKRRFLPICQRSVTRSINGSCPGQFKRQSLH